MLHEKLLKQHNEMIQKQHEEKLRQQEQQLCYSSNSSNVMNKKC